MLEKILSFERELFLAINNFHTPFLDNALWLYTGIYIWFPFIAFFLAVLSYRKSKKEWMPIVTGMIMVALFGLLIVSGFFKPYFARLRPVYHPDFMNDILMVGDYTSGGLYGFISGHATFAFGVAVFTSMLFRYKPYTFVIFLWALIMGYSRIYFGVHFLSDVVGGMCMGVLVGWLTHYLYMLYLKKIAYKGYEIPVVPTYTSTQKMLITWGLVGYVALFMLLSEPIVAVL